MTKIFDEDKDCCNIWPKIARRFDWMSVGPQPEMLTAPHINDGENKWFVNFCPSCGESSRNRKMLSNRVHY